MKTEETKTSTVPQTLTHTYDVQMYRADYADMIVPVDATSRQEAMNKALRSWPEWNVTACTQRPHILVQGGTAAKAAHEGSTIHEIKEQAERAGRSVVERELQRIIDSVTEPATPPVPDTFKSDASMLADLTQNAERGIREAANLQPGAYLVHVNDVTEILRNAIEKAYNIGFISGRKGIDEEPEERDAGLWAEAWEPTRREGEELSIAQIVREAIGTASMCWKNTPAGIFDDERAQWVAGGAINAIERVVFWKQQNEQYRADAHDEMTKLKAEAELAAYAAANEFDSPKEAECVMATQSEEDRLAWIQRNADKAAVVDLILSYRNVADDDVKMRQIKVVMD